MCKVPLQLQGRTLPFGLSDCPDNLRKHFLDAADARKKTDHHTSGARDNPTTTAWKIQKEKRYGDPCDAVTNKNMPIPAAAQEMPQLQARVERNPERNCPHEHEQAEQ